MMVVVIPVLARANRYDSPLLAPTLDKLNVSGRFRTPSPWLRMLLPAP
jgi:hypothetical protein